jgi:hypothetical protein
MLIAVYAAVAVAAAAGAAAAAAAAAAVACQLNPSVTQLASTPPLNVLPLNRISALHVSLIAPA